MCLNKKALIGLGVIAIGLVVLRPGWAVAALPFLILAICPLSMIFMMRGMKGRPSQQSFLEAGTNQHDLAPAPPATDATTTDRTGTRP
ncbi:DUF2933 domain-containing protein [Mycobacterium sp. AZCC_0083]|uniref:DUF2933 domain-containing protein n=1 Tax=Mycobacterium sp. AZCC_0083 TaxID=2735882 RepID=UPI00161BC690|nr:DUF2933 domain-containing protein [Mycobacterium sp. AZCC_0083]MBB5161719.1 hypothetical protein [Mycobacterium sp. AZCC_0083]